VLRQFNLRRPITALSEAQGWRAAWYWAVVAVVAMRLALGLVMGSVWLAVRPYVPPALRVDTTLSGGRTYDLLGEAIFAVWPRWDAVHYLNLARLGYFGTGIGVGESVYYPLYPALVSVTAPLVAANDTAAGLIVSTLASVAAFAMLYWLAEQGFGSAAARSAVFTLAVYPTAFFLLAPFTESLFLALTLGAFVTAGARRWWLAGLLGALASLTRGPGILTAVALACIAWRQRPLWRETVFSLPRPPMAVVAGLLLPVAGGAAFVVWRAAVGFPSLGSALSQYSGVEFIDPLRGLAFAILQFVRVHDLPTTLDVVSALLFCAMLVAMIANPRWRKPEWLVYMALNLVVFFSKQSVQAASLQSLARYVLVLFPAFIALGDWLSRAGQRTRFLYTLVSSLAVLVLAVGYSLWWFIG
jgi:Dolichyl-phosphate-mannose-protein mannosyltransferase